MRGRISIWVTAGLIAAAVIAPIDAAAQDARVPSLAGSVVDAEGRPLPRATITIPRISRSARADDAGRFAFNGIPAGTYRVQASLIGYAPAVREVAVARGAEVRFQLQTTPLSLEEIQVTANPTDADAQAVAQATTQLSGRTLERNLAGTIAQTLASQPGVRVRYNGPAAAVPIMRGLTGDRILILQDGQRRDRK